MRALQGRTLIAGVLGAALALATAACGGGGGTSGAGSATTTPAAATTAAKVLDIGYIADFNGSSTVAIATERGMWAKHGLDARPKVFTNGPLQVQALNAGDLDAGYLGPGALWLPASGQAKIVAVNSIGLADRVIAQPGLISIADLEGKTVGVPEGTSGDMILRLALAKAGMSIDDVTVVAMDPTTVVTAFSSRQIDAAGIWYPLIDTIKQRVPDLVELASSEDFYPQTAFPTVFVVSNDVAERDPELVRRLQAVIAEANDYRAAHLDEAVATTAAFDKAPADSFASEATKIRWLTSTELAKANSDGTVTKWLDSINRQFVSMGKLKSAPDPSSYVITPGS
jgi:NitT/TauT family transport system substrate-binding protein